MPWHDSWHYSQRLLHFSVLRLFRPRPTGLFVYPPYAGTGSENTSKTGATQKRIFPTARPARQGERMLTAQLILHSKEGDKIVDLREGATLFAGRTAECDLYLPSPAVSRRHAVFLVRGGLCGIKDLESSNGTYLNGERLNRPVRLRSGDLIQIGPFAIRFAVPEAPVYNEADKTAVLSENDIVRMVSPPATPPAPAPVSDAVTPDGSRPLAAARSAATTAIRKRDVSQPPSPDPLPKVREAEKSPPPAPRPQPSASETSVADITDASLRLRLQIPSTPKGHSVIADDEVGDGTGDAAFMEKEEDAPEQDPELALAKAAAEAGLVGEFVPDIPDPAPGDAVSPGIPAAAESTPEPFSPLAGPVELPPPPEPDPNAIPVDAAFRDAVEARLYLYSFLHDMQKERQELAAENPGLPDAVKSELDRQEREMLKPPPVDKAEMMIEKRLERRRELKAKIADAKKNCLPLPPRPSRVMREAEEIAINQWTIIAQSAREALPAAFAEGFRLVGSEPLAGILADARIDATAMMGGAAYYMALEKMLEEARYNRAFLKAKMAGMQQPAEKKGGRGGLLGLFGRKNAQPEEAAEEAPAPGESFAELAEAEEHMAQRMAWIGQEMAFLEPMLIREFWDIYARAAVHFLPTPGEITLALRAFFRYGVIGFMPWFLNAEVRDHVMTDCSKDVVDEMIVSRDVTNILYADEYLIAVLNGKCTPAMDENLEINGKNSPEWKADKALRKLINCRSQTALMRELLDSLAGRIEGFEQKAAAVEDRLAALLPGSKNFKQAKSELGQQRQAYRVEVSKLTKLAEKIRDQTLAGLHEQIEETEARFESGELPRPSAEFLIRREVEAVRKIGRLLANLKERFMPLVMRDSFWPGTDAVNDRPSIQGEFGGIELRDPAIFLENIVPSKKKQNRVDIRISPVVVLVPSAGILAFSWNPRQRPEDGRLGIPTCFIRRRLRERQLTYLLADFRWDTAKAAAGMDVMNSDTIVAAFMGVRWDWRKRSKEGREKGLIYTEQNDRTNWRRVYEAYMETAYDSGKKLFNRNYDFYERIIGKYFDLPEGVDLLRK